MKKENILEVKNLSVSFPVRRGIFSRVSGNVRAVSGVSFDLKKGKTLGLVGESGCGKSTVARAIINILKFGNPDTSIEGEVWLRTRNEEINVLSLSQSEMRKHRGYIQVIFQDPYSSLNPRMTIGKIIEEPLLYHSEMNKQERGERVKWLLEKVGLQQSHSNRYPHEFSGGQRQRVGIARALATNPSLIIADEPVSALDVSIQAQVINLLQDLQEEFNLSILFIAHDLSVVEHISSEIMVMYLGKIVEVGKSAAVYHDPVHPYSKALLSAVPQPVVNANKKQRIILKGDVPSPVNIPSGCSFRTRCQIVRPECSDTIPALEIKKNGSSAACFYVE